MKLSFVIELLLIFLLIAFAASRVIDTREDRAVKNQKQDEGIQNRYCTCSTESCNCCRDFALPVIPIRGEGCATLQYLQGDNMALSMKFGDRVLTNTTISGRKPRPVCMNLPGGYSKFCGRVYGISRDPEAFHACLGIEIRALDELEAALRLSCFRFSPEGLRLEPGKPIPPDEDDEDEDEDDYGFGVDDDEDEDEEEEDETEESEEEDEDNDEVDELEAAGVGDDNEISTDYAGFSILGDLLGFGDDSLEEPPKKKPNKKVPTPAPVAVVDKVPQQQPAPVAVVVHVSPLHNTPVVIETVTQSINNNKDTSTAAPSPAPTKAPNKARPKPQTTKAPVMVPTEAPTKAPEDSKVPEAAPTTMPSVLPTEAPFQAVTSTEFTVNVMQDGQTLQPMVEEAENEKDTMMEATTVMQEEESMEEENSEEEDENMEEEMEDVPAADIMTDEEAMEDEKAEEATEEVGIGVVKDEEPQADQGIMMTTEMMSETMETATVTEGPKLPPSALASPTVATVVTTPSGKDEVEEEADSMVEEVEEAVATVMGQGEEDEEDEEEEESEEEDEGNAEGDKEDDDYDLGVDLDDLEDEEGDKTEGAPTEDASESPRPANGERRWRKRKNRLDHIIWH